MTTQVSEELFAPVNDGITLCYQTVGDPADEPLVLVMGLGGPMTWWPEDFCRRLADAGFFVVRFDNRDIGRSSRVEGTVRRGHLVRAFAGRPVRAPYSIGDLADDVFGLLDHLGIESAHVAGVSMGGMVAQTMALARPGRVRSLASLMSTTGKRTVGWQHPSLLPAVLAKGYGREAYVESSVTMWKLIRSPGFPSSEEHIRRRAEETYDRGIDAGGVLRQMAAILTQPDRSTALRDLDVPACVLHGLSDRMVNVSGGRATARAIPGAELVLVKGWGHDLPEKLWPMFVEAIRRTADRAGP